MRNDWFYDFIEILLEFSETIYVIELRFETRISDDKCDKIQTEISKIYCLKR